MNKSDIQLNILQPFLESAANALQKGQAQYFTPIELARQIAALLPEHRPRVCDLTCGAGHLLHGIANESTELLLGSDIDSCRGQTVRDSRRIPIDRITADLTLLYPFLRQIDWRCDLFALNPPWDLHWHRERLQALAQSEAPAVRESFGNFDSRLPAEAIDSTVATLMIALDRCTYRGEGVLIANYSTLKRLVLDSRAPHRALKRHLWAVVILEGNPCTARSAESKDQGAPYQRKLLVNPAASPLPAPIPSGIQTVIAYFALDHEDGPAIRHADPGSLTAGLSRASRQGAEIIGHWQTFNESGRLWRAAGEEWKERSGGKSPKFNLGLRPDGTIAVHLSVFAGETLADKEAAGRLFALRGQHPMRLVLQRATRKALLDELSVWSVDPKLRNAVEQAMRDYHAARAPLYPLPPTQRLGYLDDEDFIVCRRNLSLKRKGSSPIRFLSGQRYALTTKLIPVERTSTRQNLEGEDEELLLTGQELVIQISAEDARPCNFMNVPALAPELGPHKLELLLEHFEIPEVPDVASLNPDSYQANLLSLEQLERLAA